MASRPRQCHGSDPRNSASSAVKDDGTFVVGYPKRSAGPRIRADGTAVEGDATIGEHGVRVTVPDSGGHNYHWFPNADRASEHYRGVITDVIDIGIPGLMRVELIEHGDVLEDKLIVRRVPTYR